MNLICSILVTLFFLSLFICFLDFHSIFPSYFGQTKQKIRSIKNCCEKKRNNKIRLNLAKKSIFLNWRNKTNQKFKKKINKKRWIENFVGVIYIQWKLYVINAFRKILCNFWCFFLPLSWKSIRFAWQIWHSSQLFVIFFKLIN